MNTTIATKQHISPLQSNTHTRAHTHRSTHKTDITDTEMGVKKALHRTGDFLKQDMKNLRVFYAILG